MGSRKKKKWDDDGGGGNDAADAAADGFRTMFVTLSMILLAFFILLNSMAVIDNKKKLEALGSLFGSFGLMTGANNSESSQDTSNTIRDASVITKQGMMKLFREAQEQVDMLVSRNLPGSAETELTFDESKGEIKVILSDQLLFPPGRAIISPRLFALLDKIAQIAEKTSGTVKVTGHTDDRQSSGISNWELSIQRGAIVARHIEAAGHLRSGMVSAGGAAHHQPRTDNSTVEGRNSNRRVEILISTKSGRSS